MAGNTTQNYVEAEGAAFLLPADEPGIPSGHSINMLGKVLACASAGTTFGTDGSRWLSGFEKESGMSTLTKQGLKLPLILHIFLLSLEWRCPTLFRG